MPYLLNLLYAALILAAMPWLLYQAIRKGKYREGFAEKFLGRVPRREAGSQKPCLWLHAVSVGEVNLLAPLIREIGRQRPDWECVLSTTTMTGMALARKKYPTLLSFYCPLDFSWAVRAAMKRIRPDVLVLAELELWPNLVRAAQESGARVAVINGRLSEHSYRGYRRIRPLVSRLLAQVDLVAAQDETYATRFRDLGCPPNAVHATGSLKYDGAQTDRNNPVTQRLRQLAGFTPEDMVFLAGSTQEGEEEVALEAFQALNQLARSWDDASCATACLGAASDPTLLADHRTVSRLGQAVSLGGAGLDNKSSQAVAHPSSTPHLRLVLVPRHPDRFDAVARLLDRSGLTWQRRSQLEAEGPNPQTRALLVDTVGELGAWWGTARIAFVGGSLGNRGGQNMIEPAAYGAAVCFGPNTWNFRDIVAAMLAREAAVVVRDAREMTAFVRRCLEDPAYARHLGDRARSLVAEQLGATQRTLQLLEPLVEQRAREPREGLAAA